MQSVKAVSLFGGVQVSGSSGARTALAGCSNVILRPACCWRANSGLKAVNKTSLQQIAIIRSKSTSQTRLVSSQTNAKSCPSRLDEEALSSGEQQVADATTKQFDALQVHSFVHRHIGPRESDLAAMLHSLGLDNMEQLIEKTVPDKIRFKGELRLPESISEHELVDELTKIGDLNEATQWRSFIGQGYYDCISPAVIMRNVFENPGWTTAYTAYQAEIAQGRLESLMNYQTMVTDLTGLDVANASLLDESTAAAEALQVCCRVDKKKRTKWLVSVRCHPQTKAVVETRASALGMQVEYFDELAGGTLAPKLDNLSLQDYCGCLVQYPNTQGHLYSLDSITRPCHEAECLVVVATDLLACTLVKPPGDFDEPADLAVGSSQRFGIPLNYGGPHAGFLAAKTSLMRSIPGRIVGLTRDSGGNQAYRFALQTREQHIRRDKATSNICTAQALLANMSAMYAVYHGPQGLREIATSIHRKTSLLARLVSNHNVTIENSNSYFDTLTLRVGRNALPEVKERALKAKINLRYYQDDENLISISLDETTKLLDVLKLASLFRTSDDNASSLSLASSISLSDLQQVESTHSSAIAPDLRRSSAYLEHPVFNEHRSEAQLVRYMKSLENKDISLAHSMIPLGSCTMKLNATSQMLASSWPQFTKCHPFQPVDQCAGYTQLFDELNEYLCEITGYDKISFQPNSGAQGEYAGLRVIRAYLDSRGDHERDVCLIPISAHGTNPASAQMAGFKIQTIKVLDDGNIDMADLKGQLGQLKDRLACLMVTYPSTFGVFEEDIREVCELVHKAGAQVYLDGANMNAQVGLCRPGDYGSDVSHLNLHKTFCIPHGGGGPGAGPIGVKQHLAPFLPSHPLMAGQREFDQSFGSVSGAMWGSPAILPISWSYIRLMAQKLKQSSQVAILSANYMCKRLEADYKILFRGSRGMVAHEFIIDCRPFKKSTNIEAVDIAKRLQDFGLHAPTVSWPVSNTLMLEPTESEDKQQLDRYCDALLAIRGEIRDIEQGRLDKLNNPIKNAPHTQQVVCSDTWTRPYSRQQAAFPANFVTPISKIWPTVGRVDDTYGDMNLFCTCPPPETTL